MAPFPLKRITDSRAQPARPGRRPFLAGCLGALVLGATAACGRSAPPLHPAVGRPWPFPDLPGVAGESRAPGGVGQALLVNFWASWCAPCRAEMAALGRLQADWSGAAPEWAGKRLGVLGISVDTDRLLLQEYLLRNPVNFPLRLDPGGVFARGLGVSVFPSTLLVDTRGGIVLAWVGERDWDAAALRQEIAQGLVP